MVINDAGALEDGGNELVSDELEGVVDVDEVVKLDSELDNEENSLDKVTSLDNAVVLVDKLEKLSSEELRRSSLDEFIEMDEGSITIEEVEDCEGNGKSHELISNVM